MEIRDPFCAFVAETNLEAHLVANLLNEAGVPAVAQEDVSPVGVHWVGPLAEIHRPKVMIETADIDRAAPILIEYESRRVARRSAEPVGTTLTIVCDQCGESARFDESLRGTVQSCPHCGEFIDVDPAGADEDEDWGVAEDAIDQGGEFDEEQDDD